MDKDMSFSSDTGMAECLVIARRIAASERPSIRSAFVSLSGRPAGFASASEIAKAILTSADIRRLEDGPYDGTRLMVGDELAGKMLVAPCSSDGEAWGSSALIGLLPSPKLPHALVGFGDYGCPMPDAIQLGIARCVMKHLGAKWGVPY